MRDSGSVGISIIARIGTGQVEARGIRPMSIVQAEAKAIVEGIELCE